MYKKLISDKSSDGMNTVTNVAPKKSEVVPKSEVVQRPEATPTEVKSTPASPKKAPQNAKGVTMNKLFSAISMMAETLDEELGLRDARMDRLDGDILEHEERIAKLEGGIGRSSEKASAPASEERRAAANTCETVPAGYTGPGRAYKYWDYKTRTFGLVSKAFAAKQLDPSYDIVHVWYENGLIHHVLDAEELKKFVP